MNGLDVLKNVLNEKCKDKESVENRLKKIGYELVNGQYKKSIFTENWAKESLKSNSSVVRYWNVLEDLLSYHYAELESGVKKNNQKFVEIINELIKDFSEDAKHIAIYAFRKSKQLGNDDRKSFKYVIEMLRNAGFVKDSDGNLIRRGNIADLAYGLNRVWLDKYIENDFDNNKTWDYIKKIAYHNKEKNTWFPKCNTKWQKENCMNQIKEALRKALQNGQSIPVKIDKKFKCFIPISFEKRKDAEGNTFIKINEHNGTKFLIGTASNTKIDKEGDRMMPSFIKKMQDTAKNLPVFEDHRHDIEHSLGFVAETGGNDDNFDISVALEKENDRVLRLLKKIEHGTPIGFSIGGSIFEAEKVFDSIVNKEVMNIIDGEINEVSITAFPAGNFDTLPVAVTKALKGKHTTDGFSENNEIGKQQATKMQTLIFDKSKYTVVSAKKWAKDHNFRNDKVDETENSIRLRQIDPSGCESNSFRTISIPGVDGIKGVICQPKSQSKSNENCGNEHFERELRETEEFLNKNLENGGEKRELIKAFTHNSTFKSGEPSWGSVDKTSLPRVAHADMGESGKKSTWRFPHHWVSGGTRKNADGVWTNGTMWLHKGGLQSAFAAAMGARSDVKASPVVIAHLNSHRAAVGLQKMRDKFSKILKVANDALATMNAFENKSEQIFDLIFSFRQGFRNIMENPDKSAEEKKTDISNFTEQLKGQINNLMDNLMSEVESQNEDTRIALMQ